MRKKFRISVLLFAVCQLLWIEASASVKNRGEITSAPVFIESMEELREYASKDNVKVKLKPGNYQIDRSESIRFLQFTGNNSSYDLTGVCLMVDTKLFSQKDLKQSSDGNSLYCAIEISGKEVYVEGLYIETYGGKPGRQSKNKMFNIVGENVTIKDIEIRTAGSNPWGYGSLYGLGGGVVRKMNGIRVGYPAKNVKVVGCKVHMRAMGHAIFIQGAVNTLIEDCHVDGLLRTTDAILAETSGFCYDKNFYAGKGGYIEGVTVSDDGKILPGEMLSLSEDGIRMYKEYKGHKTIHTTVKNCTVFQMRRGICTGLCASGDKVINCQVRSCVATGFNVGNKDTLLHCSADAKYAEAFCVPYLGAKNAYVEMEILDSRNGLANSLLAKINGTGHHVVVTTSNTAFIPKEMRIKLATKESYGNFNKKSVAFASNIELENKTNCEVLVLENTTDLSIESDGVVQR